MSDSLLFGTLPYVAFAVCAAGLAIRSIRSAGARPVSVAGRRAAGGWATAGIVAAVVLAHIVLLVAPEFVLRWNRSFPRLLVLEATGMALGLVFAVALVSRARRRDGDPAPSLSLADVALLTLLLVEAGSALWCAALYRWASSWSAAMLAPYVVSLARVAPQTESLASTPFLMRLHIFSAFAIVAIAPFTGLGLMLAIPLVRVTRSVVVPPSLACRQLARAGAEWMAKTAGVSSWDEEET